MPFLCYGRGVMRRPNAWLRFWRLALLLVGLVGALLTGEQVAAEPPPRPHYRFVITLPAVGAPVHVQQRLLFPNRTGETLDRLVLLAVPAHYGAFHLESATVDDQPVRPRLQGIVLTVPLPQPLLPGESRRLDLIYTLTVPSPGTLRFGQSQGVLALGNWYPVLAVYRPGTGWLTHSYTEVGDAFVTEVADYEATVITDPAVVVAPSGQVVAHADGRWQISAPQVRDFALALSARYVVQERDLGSIRLVAYTLPEHRAGGQAYLRWAAETLDWLQGWLSPYPWSTLRLAETVSPDPLGVGQEYPTLIFLNQRSTAQPADSADGYLAYLVTHEVIHQWFYALVGNDQVREPWLDEGITVHLSYQFLRARYPSLYPAAWNRLIQSYQAGRTVWPDRPLDVTIYEFANDTHYFTILYRKAALFLEDLRQRMGDAAYTRALRRYVQTYAGRLATTGDFLAIMAAESPVEIETLVARYFRRPQATLPTPTPRPAPIPTATLTPVPPPAPTATPTTTSSPTATVTPSPTPSPMPTPSTTPTPTPTTPTPAPPTETPSPTPTVSLPPAEGGPPGPAILRLVAVGLVAGLTGGFLAWQARQTVRRRF